MKVMQKYFLAIVPEGPIQENCTDLKNEIKQKFNVKYALKSPAHVTLKMPFSYNEAKEEVLILSLANFLKQFQGFPMQLGGVNTFGRRVIFIGVSAEERLIHLQAELKNFCKRELNLVDELSDRNFHPHLTIAYKDLKESNFEDVLRVIRSQDINGEMRVNKVSVLKRQDGKWSELTQIKLGQF
jgi:2'-5' RNA ligase